MPQEQKKTLSGLFTINKKINKLRNVEPTRVVKIYCNFRKYGILNRISNCFFSKLFCQRHSHIVKLLIYIITMTTGISEEK